MFAKVLMATPAQQSGTNFETVQQRGGDHRDSISKKESQERLSVPHCKGMEKSILDDIMGDPEDFRNLGDSDGESEGDQQNQGMLKAAVTVEKETPQEDNLQSSQGITENPQGTFSGKDNTLLSFREMKVNGDILALERQVHKSDVESQCIHVEINGDRRTNVQAIRTRYFIIKSLNHHNLEKSVKKGIWATQAMNEPILNEAFENAERVILIFSVNMSGHFQGYAQMMSSIGQRQAHVWNESNWGGTFDVEWIRLYDLPFQRTSHLKNPLNFFKPVKISRDCQELTEEIGDALCSLIDEGADGEGRIKRRSAHIGNGLSKKACTERMPWVNNDHYGSGRPMTMDGPWTSMMYPYGFPSFSNDLYNPQVPLATSGFLAQGSIANSSSAQHHMVLQSNSLVSGSPRENVSCVQDERGKNRDQMEVREMMLLSEYTEESSRVAIDLGTGGVLVDDEFLNMTYEEYLQRVGNAGPHHQGVSIWNRADEHW